MPIFILGMRILSLTYLIILLVLASCHSKETKDEFNEMKPDLEEASSRYCECMIKADSTHTVNPQECREILNEMLLNKCGSNEMAQEFVQEAIRKCVESRSKVEDENDE